MESPIGYAWTVLAATLVPCAITNGSEIPDDSEFTVSQVVDSSTINGIALGRSITVRIASIAHISELPASAQRRDAPFAEDEMRRFRDNQTICTNYLRCLLRSANRVLLRHIESLAAGQARGEVYVAMHPRHDALRINAADLMIRDGFALPSFGLAAIPVDEDDPLCESYEVMNCLNIARNQKCGLWADKAQTSNDARSLPLPNDVVPACAMPLRSFPFPAVSGQRVRSKEAPRVALTVVCANQLDTEKVAGDAEWINERAFEFLKMCDGNEISAANFVNRFEQHMTSVVLARVSHETGQHTVSVLVRHFGAMDKSSPQMRATEH